MMKACPYCEANIPEWGGFPGYDGHCYCSRRCMEGHGRNRIAKEYMAKFLSTQGGEELAKNLREIRDEDSALSSQEGGDHYKTMKIQPVEYITANDLDFLQGSVVKYISRHKSKNGAEDIRKAIHFCQLILQIQYGEKG